MPDVRTRLLRALPPLASLAIPLAVYLAGSRYLGSGDTRPAELLPIALLGGRGFDLIGLVDPAEKYPYWYHRVGGRLVSSYPVLPGLLNVPVFAAARAAGVDLEANRERLSLITASVLCALSAFFLFEALVRIGSRPRDALALTLLYAFGTCVWSVASRAIWQHGPSVFLLTAALWLLLRGDRASVAASGLFLALAVVNRPSNVLIAAPLFLFVLRRRRDALPAFVLLAGVPLVLHAAYTSVYLGSPLSTGYWNAFPEVANFRGNPIVGLAGLLVSPSRGLFVFSPFFLFAIAGAVIALRDPERWPIAPYLAAGSLLLILLYSKWSTWWGGHTFGYRYLIEATPGLMVLTAIAWDRIRTRRGWRVVFLVCCAWSLLVQGLGVRYQPSGFNQRMDQDPSVLWSVRDSEIAMSTRKALEELRARGSR
jgi:hypothetical protein